MFRVKLSYFSVSDEDGEKSVSVLLDAEESELIFLDNSNTVSTEKKKKYIYIEIIPLFCIIYNYNYCTYNFSVNQCTKMYKYRGGGKTTPSKFKSFFYNRSCVERLTR